MKLQQPVSSIKASKGAAASGNGPGALNLSALSNSLSNGNGTNNSASAQKMKINRSQIAGAPSSIMKPRDSSSSVGRGINNNNNNNNNSTIGGRGLSSNYHSIVSHDRHVSFDKNSAFNSNTHNQSHQAANNSTALATLIASGNKYGSTQGNGISGVQRKKSPIDAQLAAVNAYQDENSGGVGVSGASVGKQLSSLAEEYKQRQKRMDERLKQEIENHAIAPVTGKVPAVGVKKFNAKDIRAIQRRSSASPLQSNDNIINTSGTGGMGLLNLNSQSDLNNPPLSTFSNPLLSGSQVSGGLTTGGGIPNKNFFRSQRSVAMRIKDSYEVELQNMERGKLELIQRLNDALLELDKLNQDKAQLSNALIQQIQFVRDMQRETSKGEDIQGVVSDDLKLELRQEKELCLALKEQLKTAEQERLRLLARMQDLGQQLQVGEVKQGDLQVEVSVRGSNCEQLVREIEIDREDIAAKDELIMKIREQLLQNNNAIRGLRESLEMVVDEKREVHGRMRSLEDKYEEVVRNFEREQRETHDMQTRHIKLITSNILFESLKEVHKNNMQSHLNQFKEYGKAKFNMQKGLRQLRVLMKQNRRQRLRRYLYQWFSKALDPMRVKKHKKRLAVQLRCRNPSMMAFYQWQLAFQQSISRTHKKKQVILRMLQSKDDFHLRAQKFMFIKWRDMIRLNSEDRRRILSKFVIKRQRDYLVKYFSYWLGTSQELDNQIQLNGLAQRLAVRKYQSVVFFGWQQVISDWKNRRQSIISRTFKNMKIYTLTRKQLRAQTWSVLREQKRHTHNLVQACFDGWRIQKEQDKLVRVSSMLNQDEYIRQEDAKRVIQEVSEQDAERYKAQATKALAKCFGKKLNQYFRKWQQFTEAKREMIETTLKQRVITLYLCYLRQGFNSFLVNKGQALIQFQSEQISEEQQRMQEQQTHLVQQNLDIEERKQRQQCLSSKQIKKILSSAYEKRLKEHFHIWRQNLKVKAEKQDQLDKVLGRLNRRQKRQSFERYKAKVRDLQRELKCELHVTQMKLRLEERLKRKVYSSLQLFAGQHLRAKNYMRRLLTRLDLSLKETIFKRWQRYENYRSVKLLQQGQNEIVEHLSELQNDFQTKSDQLEDFNQQNKKLKGTLENNGRRLIRNAFLRCLEGSLGYGFSKWVQLMEAEREKQRRLAFRFVHLFKGTLANAFRTWSKSIRAEMQMIYEEGISSEEKQIARLEHEIKSSNNVFSREADEAGTHLEKQKEMQQEFMKKHQNCLRALINRKDNQDFISKQRHILQTWHQFVRSRKSCIKILENVIQKTLWYQGLKAIKERSMKMAQDSRRELHSRKIVYKYSKIKLRYAFAQWREFAKRQLQGFTAMLEGEKAELINQREKYRSQVIERAKDQMIQQSKEKSLFEVFLSWKNYSANLKQLRVKVATYQAQSIERDKQRVILKWQSRRLATQKLQHQQQKIDRVYDRNLVVTIFKAWQDHNFMNKRLSSSLSGLASIVDKVYKKSALERMRLESERRQFQMERSKVRGTEKLFETLAFIATKRKSQVVNELKHFGIMQKKNFKGLQSVLKYQITRGLRDLFNRWREESERKTVVKFMHEEGPVAIQNHILKKMIYNLKTKVREEGFAPREINDMLIHSRRQSMQSLEKSICRLVSFKDNELYLLPKCIDQWKKWVHMRKLYRYWLNYLNNKIDVKRSPMFWAFQKWKHGELERRMQLSKLKKAKLLQISCKNEEKMHDLVQNLEQADLASDELTEQRDLLLQRYVGSQRLALAVINGQNEIAKQKAIARWANTNQQEVQEDYEDALKENLRRIQALKDRIKHLEVSNNELADQNEDLRQGALDGIEMAKQIDDLNRDREKLSVDLADKAITIKKLLEDNNNLSIRLGNAQEEAQNLIRMSQMKLQESSNRFKRSAADNNRFASPQYDFDY